MTLLRQIHKQMPQSEGYVSLNEGSNSVYNSTTEPTRTNSVIETVKKAIGHAIGAQDTKSLLNGNDNKAKIQSTMINIR